jgi:lethal(2) giant larvae protein
LQVGTFDPYSDDPRLAVKKVALCPVSGTLVVAGTAGSVIVARMNSDSVEKEVEVLDVLIMACAELILPLVECSFGRCRKA